ncbi:MAG: aminopeptidase P family protein [Actinomycetales bacterium]|nr:aminopeptidase P family protein [Actinomycetales bacterium]
MSWHEQRTQNLQAILAESGHAGLVVTDLVNIRYLTGFTGSNALLLVPAAGECAFFTDGRYLDQAREQVWIERHEITRDLVGAALGHGLGGWAAETHLITVDEWRTLGELPAAGNLIERLRLIKDEPEIEALTQACEISAAALTRLWEEPLLGVSERQIAVRIETLMRELGADDRAFDTIVASGPNSAIPHHEPTERLVEPGDFLKIDFGALVAGYRADCTRTVVIGQALDWQREIYVAVRQAQALGVQALKPGASIADIDAQVRRDLAESGWLESFTTGLGHGVGLRIHEDPFFTSTSVGRIERRMVLTMEPGIYLADRGGVRIEDTVLVDQAGPVVLTDVTTELMEIS